MVTPTLTGMTSLGKLQLERVDKQSGIVVLPFPLEDSDSNEGSGFTGATTDIDIEGIIPTTSSDVDSTRTEIQDLSDPNPTSTRTYTSDMFTAGVTVLVISSTAEYRAGDQNRIHYTIRMQEVGTII